MLFVNTENKRRKAETERKFLFIAHQFSLKKTFCNQKQPTVSDDDDDDGGLYGQLL